MTIGTTGRGLFGGYTGTVGKIDVIVFDGPIEPLAETLMNEPIWANTENRLTIGI